MKQGCNKITITTIHGYVDTGREYLERGKSASNIWQKSLFVTGRAEYFWRTSRL